MAKNDHGWPSRMPIMMVPKSPGEFTWILSLMVIVSRFYGIVKYILT